MPAPKTTDECLKWLNSNRQTYRMQIFANFAGEWTASCEFYADLMNDSEIVTASGRTPQAALRKLVNEVRKRGGK